MFLKYIRNQCFLSFFFVCVDPLPEWSPLRSFRVPHSLALIEPRDILCVADRENARIQCFDIKTGVLERQLASPVFGEQIFAISYNSVEGSYFVRSAVSRVLINFIKSP